MNTANYTIIPHKIYTEMGLAEVIVIDLTHEELLIIDELIKIAVEEYNVEEEIWLEERAHIPYYSQKERFLIKLEEYNRQYVPIINKDGEKEVWINCFRGNGFPEWRKEIVSVEDGGKSFFNFKINLSKRIFYNFQVNGYA